MLSAVLDVDGHAAARELDQAVMVGELVQRALLEAGGRLDLDADHLHGVRTLPHDDRDRLGTSRPAHCSRVAPRAVVTEIKPQLGAPLRRKSVLTEHLHEPGDRRGDGASIALKPSNVFSNVGPWAAVTEGASPRGGRKAKRLSDCLELLSRS